MPNIIFAYLITKVAAKKIEATSKIVRENLTTSPCPHDMSLDDIKKKVGRVYVARSQIQKYWCCGQIPLQADTLLL